MKGLEKIAGDAIGNSSKVFKCMTLVSSICVMLLMLYTIGDVSGRYMFNKPLPASFQISTVLMVFIVFLSLASVQARGGHLRLEFVWQRFAPRGQAICDILLVLIGLFILSIITWQGWEWALEAWKTNERMEGILEIPYLPSRMALTIGAFFLCTQYIIDLIRHINKVLSIKAIAALGRQQ